MSRHEQLSDWSRSRSIRSCLKQLNIPILIILLVKYQQLKHHNRRFIESAQRVVNPPTVKISEPPKPMGVSPTEVAEALSAGGKGKKLKAYRRSDSGAGSGGARSRSHTKELALPPDDSLMCPPSFLTGLKPDQGLDDGARLELRVQVKGDPDPQVSWTKDGKLISSSDIMEVKYKNGVASVIIAEVFPEDAGRYTCKATNTKGSVETSSRVTIIPCQKAVNGSVNGSAGSSAPHVFKHLNSQVVKDGDAVRLECTVGGAERFDVVWLHNEKEIKPSKDFEYKSSGNTYTLEITEIFPEDAGTYTCEAFNDIGECFTTCTLIVEVPGEDPTGPEFKQFPISMTASRGSSASFSGELSCAPSSVIWMKDGRELHETPMKYKITTSGPRLSLDIMEVSSADAGQYALIVSGKKGESKAAFSINI